DQRARAGARRALWLARPALAGLAALALAACSMGGFPDMGGASAPAPDALPAVAGKTFGTGPVRVALLLPLSGDPGLAAVGTSMANAAALAIGEIEQNPAIPDNITIVLKDTGPSIAGATQAASQAVQEGASLILGPLKAEQVTAAG